MPRENSTRDAGRRVEELVAAQLAGAGLEIVDRNFEAAGAEVDLVAIDRRRDDEVYVFVEVRSRAGSERGSPIETVDRKKQRRIVRAATAWLVGRQLWERVDVRFDVIGVLTDVDPPQVDWLENAFQVDR